MSIVRKNPITDEWVVYAVDRSQRPSDLKLKEKLHTQTDEEEPELIGFTCPFCPGQESLTPPAIFERRKLHQVYAIKGADQVSQWQTRTFENKFPIFKMPTAASISSQHQEQKTLPNDDQQPHQPHATPLLQELPHSGAHLVVVEHPDHNQTFFQMSSEEMLEILLTYQEAYRWLEAEQPNLAYILTIKNYQRQAGASLHHPHSQLIGTSLIPDRVGRELASFQRHHHQTGQCIFCELIREEAGREREIQQTDHYQILAPFSSRFSYETWILPRKHQRRFIQVSPEELRELAEVLVQHFQRLNHRLGDFPFNLYIHEAPLGGNRDFHWHLEILPRVSSMAGFELGGGVQVNSVLPETVAKLLRQRGEE